MTALSALKTKLIDAGIEFVADASMSNYTSFKIGGPADILIEVASSDEAVNAINICRSCGVDITVIGKGSNLLVSDEGISGAVIVFSAKNSICAQGNLLTAEAGVPLTALCTYAKNRALSGLEFAYGIPASVGGAVYMNAGAYGGSISDVLVETVCLMPNGSIQSFHRDDFDFGYRKSCFMSNGAVILGATFQLIDGNVSEIADTMSELMGRRKDKQPLEYPSAGSVFKRPEGYFAGALIEQSGLKGYRIGGAEVSVKHAGFIVNREGATCADVLALVDHIRKTVFAKFGVELETEIRKIGR